MPGTSMTAASFFQTLARTCQGVLGRCVLGRCAGGLLVLLVVGEGVLRWLVKFRVRVRVRVTVTVTVRVRVRARVRARVRVRVRALAPVAPIRRSSRRSTPWNLVRVGVRTTWRLVGVGVGVRVRVRARVRVKGQGQD
jgi:hypothetical protein